MEALLRDRFWPHKCYNPHSMSALLSSSLNQDMGVSTEPPSPAPVSSSWAVVSFLFEDAVWCDWLYREFDGERIPRPLIARPSRFGTPYPERISVSPDPADPSQLESYADSLRCSQHLILIVSPASGKSPMLQEHMRLFKASGGEERIVALVVKGEPASPAAEPGTEADADWLPSWLAWRFENNAFKSASRSEPLIVDARLGLQSLAEVRARIMAALLEVDQAELTELGIVTRPTTTLIEFPSPAQLDAVPLATPSSIRFVEIADSVPQPQRHSNFPIWLCGMAAVSALTFLLCMPDNLLGNGAKPRFERTSHRAAVELSSEEPLVEARPILDAPLPQFSQAASTRPVQATPEIEVTAQISQPAVRTSPSQATPTETFARSASLSERERLTRLAESQMAEGNSQEALETLTDAIAKGLEAAELPDAPAADLLSLCHLYKRAGTLAEGLGRPAVAKNFYESGRRLLLEWKTTAPRPKDILKVLADFESSLRPR